jgi:hypothetical protein
MCEYYICIYMYIYYICKQPGHSCDLVSEGNLEINPICIPREDWIFYKHYFIFTQHIIKN